MSNLKLITKFTLWVQDIESVKTAEYSTSLKDVATFS